jgi:hypothetical protein
MKNLKTIQQTINSKSFLTGQQTLTIKGGNGQGINPPADPNTEIALDGEGEVLRRKRKPAGSL